MNARLAKTVAGALAGVCVALAAWAADDIATLRGSAIDAEPEAPALGNPSNKDLRRARNYPEQPPTIPHKVRDYQVDLSANQCLACHGRRAVEDSQAPMISVTHYADRDGQIRGFMSPRRYYCYQCHVPQQELKPLVGNEFIDVDDLVRGEAGAGGSKAKGS